MRRVSLVIGCIFLLSFSLFFLTGCWREIEASITATTTFSFPPLEVAFDGSQSHGGNGSITEYWWDLDDGDPAYGITAAHTYTEPGPYTPMLKITDSSGDTDTASVRIVVLQMPIAQFSHEAGISPALFSQPDPLTVAFDGSSSVPYTTSGGWSFWGRAGAETQTITSFEWSFGDGTTGTGSGRAGWFGISFLGGQPVTHTYAEAGAYEVTLTVACNYGYTHQTTQTIVVGEPDEPIEPDGPDLIEGFAIVSSFWQATDDEEEEEEEDHCIDVWGSVKNNGLMAAGCELTATAYDGLGNPAGTAVNWPSADTNIAAGATLPYGFIICSLSIPADEVASVEVEITDAQVWQ